MIKEYRESLVLSLIISLVDYILVKTEIIEKDMRESIQKQENINIRIGRIVKILLTVIQKAV